MPKTLVIAEKPSVGQDLARVLPGPFQKHTGAGDKTARWLEGPDHTITWAVGHLVQLAEPDEYDDKFKKWRMADLPIVPGKFKLVVRDERSQKQMTVVKSLLKSGDYDLVVNACDAGREGELIFAYLFEKAGAKLPVERLWLNSMTESAIREGLDQLRDGTEMASLEQAARSRSEADWIVGMNATRAATIRLRSSFDGAVSLGRVQTPTLAIMTRREEEIRAFVPQKYWEVQARFEAAGGRDYEGIWNAPKGESHLERADRIPSAERAEEIVAAVTGRQGTIAKLEKTSKKTQPPLLYDLTSLQREANNRLGFTARRTLAAAQRCYDEHKVLTYPRTSSRYITSDMVPDIAPTAALVGRHEPYAEAARYIAGLDVLPLGRVVNDAKVGDHHAIIPTNAEHRLDKLGDDDRRIYDLVTRRFLAVFQPDSVAESTRIETEVEGHIFKTSGRVLKVPGWRAIDNAEGRDSELPVLEQGESVDPRDVQSEEKETKPPGRYSDASLLGAMETAGKLVDEEELREAMKESGIGTPATRAAIIERLIDVGYVERDRTALVPTEKGMNVIRLLDDHALTRPDLTGEWERRLARIEAGEETREAFMSDIATFAGETVGQLDTTLKDVRIPRENLGPCPVCGQHIMENRKGYSCWSREDPGCGFVIWKSKAGKQMPPAVAKELIRTGRTAKQVTGFRGRSGRSFRAKLALEQTPEGKWRVEFDEAWAKEGAREAAVDEVEAAATAATDVAAA